MIAALAEKTLRTEGDLVQRFVEIAYRKVRIEDEYGDENWEALDREIDIVMGKLRDRHPTEVGEGTAEATRVQTGSHGGPQYVVCEDGNAWPLGESPKLGYLPSPYLLVEAHDADTARRAAGDRRQERLANEVADAIRVRLRGIFRDQYSKLATSPAQEAVLDEITGEEFEVIVMSWLRELGAEGAHMTPRTGDQGADIVFVYGTRRVAVQCKRYSGSVGNDAVQEAHAARTFYGCTDAWVVTTGTFTPSARALAQRTHVVLVERATRGLVGSALAGI